MQTVKHTEQCGHYTLKESLNFKSKPLSNENVLRTLIIETFSQKAQSKTNIVKIWKGLLHFILVIQGIFKMALFSYARSNSSKKLRRSLNYIRSICLSHNSITVYRISSTLSSVVCLTKVLTSLQRKNPWALIRVI